MSLSTALREAFQRFENRPAVEEGDRVFTYGGLWRRAEDQLRSFKQRSSAGLVALTRSPGIDLLEQVLACAMGGLVYLYLDPGESADWREARLQDSGACLWDEPTSQRVPPEIEAGGDPYCLVYTSGSLGQPKGILRGGKALLGNLVHYRAWLNLQPYDRVASLTTPRFGTFASTTFGAWLSGACLLPFDLPVRGPVPLLDWLETQRISLLHTVPTVYRRLMRLSRPSQLESLRVIKVGGEALFGSDVGLARGRLRPHCRLLNGLAQTEAGGNYCYYEVDRRVDGELSLIPVGRPRPDCRVHLADSGEIILDCPTAALAYWRGGPLPRPLPTGDLGRWDGAGNLVHLGRLDNRVKVAGVGVDLADVAAELRALPQVREVFVTARLGQIQAALHCSSAISAKRLGQRVRARLGRAAVPSRWFFPPLWPRLPGGKTDAGALRALMATPEPATAPATPLEQELAALWERTLGVPVGREQNFFSLGGDSLSAAQLAQDLSRRCGVAVAPSDFLIRPTVSDWADFLTSPAQMSSRPPILHLRQLSPQRLWIIPGGAAGSYEWFEYNDFAQRLPSLWSAATLDLSGRVGLDLESLANWLLPLLIEHNPEELWLLGDCLGGALAHRVATLAQQRGTPTRLLLLNCPLPRRSWRWRRRWRHLISLPALLVDFFGVGASWRDLLGRAHRFLARLVASQVYAPPLADRAHYQRLRDRYRDLNHSARLRPFDGPTLLLTTQDHEKEACGWESFCRGPVQRLRLPGNHPDRFENCHLSWWLHADQRPPHPRVDVTR